MDKPVGKKPSDGEIVIRSFARWFQKYVCMSDAQALAVALWAINTWIYDKFENVPFLEIFAQTKRSGKTTLLSLLAQVTRGGQMFAIVRPISIFKWIEFEEGKVSVLVDEAEQFSKSTVGDARSGMAAGFGRGGRHMVVTGKGPNWYRTFVPWAFACIGTVHDVLRDRCIEIMLTRGTPSTSLSENAEIASAEAQALVGMLIHASKTYGVGNMPIVPATWLTDRERQMWTPLVSIATWLHASPELLAEITRASKDLSDAKLSRPAAKFHCQQAEQDADGRDASERILRDLVSVLRDGEAFITSGDAVERLRGIDAGPWRVWQGNGINPMTLATLLARYGIKSEQKRMPMRKGIGGERVEVFYTEKLRSVKL